MAGAGVKAGAELCQTERNLARGVAPSTMVKIPASRARVQISFTGKFTAVGLVMWLMKITRV